MKSPIRYLSLAVAAAGLAALSAQAESAVAAKPLGSAVFAWDSLAATPTSRGFVRNVVDAPTPTMDRFSLHVTTLNPGQESHPPHHHPQEEIIVVKEGTVEVSINGAKKRTGPGGFIFFASHDVHNLKNVGDQPATYYVINFYTPATAAVRNQPAVEWAPPQMLRSMVIPWESLTATSAAGGVRRPVVDSPTLTLARLEVHATTVPPAAAATPAHRHPWLMLVLMREGEMEATIDGVAHRCGPGAIVYFAPNALQTMKNPGFGPATYVCLSASSALTGHASD